MYIQIGMRATVIQYSINVRTPKIGFSGVLFIERSPHRTVSPFPDAEKDVDENKDLMKDNSV